MEERAMSRFAKAALVITAACLAAIGAFAVSRLAGGHERESGEESLADFAREHADLRARKLPIAVIRE
jgi:hypothetical protein